MVSLKKLEESKCGFEPILPSVCAFGILIESSWYWVWCRTSGFEGAIDVGGGSCERDHRQYALASIVYDVYVYEH